MKFSTSFKLSSSKSLIEKIKDAIHPKNDENFTVNAEVSYEISTDELKELYREYRSEMEASDKDVTDILNQISKIWNALKNGIHNLLKEVISSEDDIFEVQNVIHRLYMNAAENKSESRIFNMKLEKEEKNTEEILNKKTTEE